MLNVTSLEALHMHPPATSPPLKGIGLATHSPLLAHLKPKLDAELSGVFWLLAAQR